MKISFDFDYTLSRPTVYDFAKSLVDKGGFDIWIVTSRHNDNDKWGFTPDNSDLYKVAAELNIPDDKIHFTNGDDKWGFIKDKDFILHLDDDWIELNLINRHTNTKGISVWGNTTWKQKCKKILGL